MNIKNQNLKVELLEKGYAKKQIFSANTIDKLKNVILKKQNLFTFNNKKSVTVLEKNLRLRKAIHSKIEKIVSTELNFLFSEYKIPIASFFLKEAMAEKTNFHQDAMITDQNSSPSFGIWFSLSDSSISNGGIGVVPYSHKMFPPFQSEYIYPPFQNHLELLGEFVQNVHLSSGEAIIMDNRLIHHTGKNNSTSQRNAVVIKIASQHEELKTIFSNGKKIFVVEQPNNFYLNSKWINSKFTYQTGRYIGYLNYSPKQFSERTLIEHLQRKKKNEIILPISNYTNEFSVVKSLYYSKFLSKTTFQPNENFY